MKRQHFFGGFQPLPADHDTLQNNAENAINDNLVNITGAGVLEGLTCTVNGENLDISAGKATAPSGKALVFTSTTSVALADGLVLLRNTVTDTSTTTDLAGNIVWEHREDVASVNIKPTAQADDVILGTIADGTYTTASRQVALAWHTLKDYIDTSIATAKAAAKDETKDELIPVGFEYVQLPKGKAPKAGTYARPDDKGDVVISEADALGWPGTWEIHEDYADSAFVCEGADNTVANEVNKAEDDIPNDHGAQPFEGQTQPMPDAGRNSYGEWEGVSDSTGAGVVYNRFSIQTGGGEGGMWRRAFAIKLSRDYGINHTAAEFRPQQYTVRTWRRIA